MEGRAQGIRFSTRLFGRSWTMNENVAQSRNNGEERHAIRRDMLRKLIINHSQEVLC